MSNRDTIDAFLAGTLRFTRAGRAGALGNIEVESNYSPTAYNPGEHAIGLCQWELGRRTELQRYAARHSGHETDLAMQLGFMATELHEIEFSDVLRVMTAATTTADLAAVFWDKNYERSAGTSRTTRIAKARRIYDELGPTPGPEGDDEMAKFTLYTEIGGHGPVYAFAPGRWRKLTSKEAGALIRHGEAPKLIVQVHGYTLAHLRSSAIGRNS
jgi:hypothetical protein